MQRFGALAHAVVEQVAIGAHGGVQGGHLLRGQVLRALEQVALLVVFFIGPADALEKLAPEFGVRRAGFVLEAEPLELARQQRVQGHFRLR